MLGRLVAKLRAQATADRRPIDVLGVGECSLDQVYVLPGKLRDFVGGKCRATAADSLGGGQVATAMCALRRLGWRSGYCGVVGDDAAGAAVLAGLRADAVAPLLVRVLPGVATRTALLLVDADGERSVIEWRDPALQQPADCPDAALIASARVVHVDGSDLAAALRCARIAQQQGGLVSIDLDLGSGQLPVGSDELIALADLCVVPRGLPEALTGHPDVATAALALGQRTAGLVVVTLGSAGCLAVSDGQVLTQPALRPPGRIVDTTACGDTFRAALLSQVLAAAAGPDPDPATDQRLTAALRYACAAAALKCQQAGRKGCPTGDAVAAFLNQPGAER